MGSLTVDALGRRYATRLVSRRRAGIERPLAAGVPSLSLEAVRCADSANELALLDYYRALRPAQRAALLEALVRMIEPVRQATNRPRTGQPGAH